MYTFYRKRKTEKEKSLSVFRFFEKKDCIAKNPFTKPRARDIIYKERIFRGKSYDQSKNVRFGQ